MNPEKIKHEETIVVRQRHRQSKGKREKNENVKMIKVKIASFLGSMLSLELYIDAPLRSILIVFKLYSMPYVPYFYVENTEDDSANSKTCMEKSLVFYFN